MNTTVAPDEIEKFSRIADEWWDLRGKFAPLHRINPLRVGYIKQQIIAHYRTSATDLPLSGIRLLDIGCGGGLVCEPLATLGARVTGIDASEKNIAVAKIHAEKSGIDIDYRCMSAEALVLSLRGAQATKQSIQNPQLQPMDRHAPSGAREDDLYDVVLALEIIEHVTDIGLFVQSVMQLVRPGGLVIFSTMNRTAKAYALAVIGAEYILRWLPRGTHDWNKFVRPSELLAYAERAGGSLHHMTGMVMNPLSFEWSLKEHDMRVNYLMSIKKTI